MYYHLTYNSCTLFSYKKCQAVSLFCSRISVVSNSLYLQDNRDLFGFERHRRNHSGSSSLGPSVIREELKYIHDDDDVIVKV